MEDPAKPPPSVEGEGAKPDPTSEPTPANPASAHLIPSGYFGKKEPDVSEAKKLHVHILISLLTLLFAPLASGLVVYFQLNREHAFQSQQTSAAIRLKRMDEKVALLKDVSNALYSLQNLRLAHYMTNLSANVSLRFELAGAEKYEEKTKKDMEKLEILQEQITDEYHRLSTDLTKVSIFFGDDVKKLILPLDKFLRQNLYIKSSDFIESTQEIDKLVSAGTPEGLAVIQYMSTVGMDVQSDQFQLPMASLITAMSLDVAKDFNVSVVAPVPLQAFQNQQNSNAISPDTLSTNRANDSIVPESAPANP